MTVSADVEVKQWKHTDLQVTLKVTSPDGQVQTVQAEPNQAANGSSICNLQSQSPIRNYGGRMDLESSRSTNWKYPWNPEKLFWTSAVTRWGCGRWRCGVNQYALISHLMIISASILSADFSHLAEQIKDAEAGGVDWIHIDVMDGHFVPNITMGPFIVETCRRITRLPLDVHLMVEKPENHLEAFINAGATYLSIHIETCPHVFHTLQLIRSLGCHPGIVIDPGTPINAISAVAHLVDMVLIMTVNPGASGQEFLPEVISKIPDIKALIPSSRESPLIEVDGGITPETLPYAYAAGARVLYPPVLFLRTLMV